MVASPLVAAVVLVAHNLAVAPFGRQQGVPVALLDHWTEQRFVGSLLAKSAQRDEGSAALIVVRHKEDIGWLADYRGVRTAVMQKVGSPPHNGLPMGLTQDLIKKLFVII